MRAYSSGVKVTFLFLHNVKQYLHAYAQAFDNSALNNAILPQETAFRSWFLPRLPVTAW